MKNTSFDDRSNRLIYITVHCVSIQFAYHKLYVPLHQLFNVFFLVKMSIYIQIKVCTTGININFNKKLIIINI